MATIGTVTLTLVAMTPVQNVYAVRADDNGVEGEVVHGLIDTPQELTFMATTSAISAVVAAAAVADKTKVYFMKSGVMGSGGAVPGTTVIGYLSAKLMPSQIASVIFGTPVIPEPPG